MRQQRQCGPVGQQDGDASNCGGGGGGVVVVVVVVVLVVVVVVVVVVVTEGLTVQRRGVFRDVTVGTETPVGSGMG